MTDELICPECRSKSVALILWGYPNMDTIQEELDRGKITLGGCMISDNDPKWECNDCGHRWGDANHNDESDNIDSFDYDKGYNLDEVYD